MDKELLEASIKTVETSLETSRDNLKKAKHHIAEGEVILKALNKELKTLS